MLFQDKLMEHLDYMSWRLCYLWYKVIFCIQFHIELHESVDQILHENFACSMAQVVALNYFLQQIWLISSLFMKYFFNMCKVFLLYVWSISITCVEYFSHVCEIIVQSISLTHFFRSRVHQGETDLKSNLGQTEVLFHCCQVIKQETYQFLAKYLIQKPRRSLMSA